MIELVLRIGFSLLVVLGLMWALARMARRPLRRRAGAGGAALAVLSRAQLGRNASVAVVRVVDRALIVGVTEGQVNLLGETDLAGLQRAIEEPSVHRRAVDLDPLADPPAARPGPHPNGPRSGGLRPGGPRPDGSGPLQGSLLSPATWSQTVDFLRERTARRG